MNRYTPIKNPNRFALFMCCNYPGTPARLSGCIADGNNVFNFLMRKRGFDSRNMTRLYDRGMTQRNMITHLDNFAKKTNEIGNKGQVPQCVLYYSGHGIRMPLSRTDAAKLVNNPTPMVEDAEGNEALVPYDYRSNRFLLDDYLFANFVKKLHPKTELFIMTDCCNSGTNFDLKYQNLVDLYSKNNIETKIIQLAGCQDNQYAIEVNGAGVLTTRFVEIMDKSYNRITNIKEFGEIFKVIYTAGYVQNPQVSVSNNTLFESNLFDWLRLPSN